MERIRFLVDRITEREAYWAEVREGDPDLAGLVEQQLDLCARDRRALDHADPLRPSRAVELMLLGYSSHPDFRRDWHPLYA
ncbi:hypothetical protein [Pimelobacter sp. 30-1]|uniref:hypothetical protein n=1 Tax=Pimelobacter TaxID=2044 RepID=UPI001C0499C0|nr:hypothetical protein [Pimelobacter sp. 30-1]MBU2697956.1 hypothetical protein [Pimelobacter sp. 30-1]